MKLDADQVAVLVRSASQGHQPSWDALVEEYSGLIWAITRSFHLTSSEAADVSQTTWLRLCENVDRLREPGAVGAWLATTARRECAAVRSRSRSVVLLEDMSRVGDYLELEDAAEAGVLHEEAVASVRNALAHLPDRTRTMLTMLMQDEPLSYEQVACALNVPIGSIGPTRGRALRRLRRILEDRPEVGETVLA